MNQMLIQNILVAIFVFSLAIVFYFSTRKIFEDAII